MAENMIQIQGVEKSFGAHRVLQGVDLTVPKGETLVIMGQSGGGKSVLLKHMIGLLKPDRGQVLIDGRDIAPLTGRALDKVRLRFGMLFQGAALFDSMTVAENVGFALREHTSMSERQIKDRVEECLRLVGLFDVGHKPPSALSGGMRKRVGLARAVAMSPDIVLYDEPTTGLDPIMADLINELIITLRDNLRVTSVVVTHDLVSAYKVADRIAMLYNGKIIEVGTPDEIRQTRNAVVQQFIQGKAVGPIQEGLPDKAIFERWSARPVRWEQH
jgi:phospholipid/cholesterol/gamma-HCH transport system ATP-binding protein